MLSPESGAPQFIQFVFAGTDRAHDPRHVSILMLSALIVMEETGVSDDTVMSPVLMSLK